MSESQRRLEPAIRARCGSPSASRTAAARAFPTRDRRPHTNSSEPYRELARFAAARLARGAPASGRVAARTIYHLRSPRTVEPKRATSCGSHGLDLHSPHAARKGPARGCRAVRTSARFFFVTTQCRTGTLLGECG